MKNKWSVKSIQSLMMLVIIALAIGKIGLGYCSSYDDNENSIVGSWGKGHDGDYNSGGSNYASLTFYKDGYYIHWQSDKRDEAGDMGGGVEYGRYDYDADTQSISIQPIVDENGCIGPSDYGQSGSGGIVSVDQNILHFGDTTLERVQSSGSLIVGGWGKGHDGDYDSGGSNYTSLTFYENGYYIHWQSDKRDEDGDMGGGVEYGRYDYDADTQSISIQPIVDENGCIGPSDYGQSGSGGIVSVDQNILHFGDTTLERVQMLNTPILPADTIYDDFNTANINGELWIDEISPVLSQSNGLWHSSSPPNATYGNMGSTYAFRGDCVFDLDYRDFQATGTDFSNDFQNISLQVSSTTNMHDDFIFICRGYDGAPFFFSSAELEGNWVASYNASVSASTPSGILRIIKSGAMISTYYNEGAGWTLLRSYPNAFSDNVTIQVRSYTGDNGSFSVSSDYIRYSGELATDEGSNDSIESSGGGGGGGCFITSLL